MLTNDNFKEEKAHLGGVQRLYEFPGGWQLSLVNSSMLHSYPFAWEAAVINPNGDVDYSTPLTSDVEVFMSDDEASDFIERAKQHLGSTGRENQLAGLIPRMP